MRKWVVKNAKWKQGGSRFKYLPPHAWYLKSYRVMIGANEARIIPMVDFDGMDAPSLIGSKPKINGALY